MRCDRGRMVSKLHTVGCKVHLIKDNMKKISYILNAYYFLADFYQLHPNSKNEIITLTEKFLFVTRPVAG